MQGRARVTLIGNDYAFNEDPACLRGHSEEGPVRAMPAYEIPDDLIAMLKGAGSSRLSGPDSLPRWACQGGIPFQRISEDVEDTLTFKQVKEYCKGDNLQIAEYYLLRSDRSIGPLRHAIRGRWQTSSR